jgi:hypothetical protein
MICPASSAPWAATCGKVTFRYLVCPGGPEAAGTIGMRLPTEPDARINENSSGCRRTYDAAPASVTGYAPCASHATGPVSRRIL